jgi:predicted metal-dependent TIM-barrel fold hydrolase
MKIPSIVLTGINYKDFNINKKIDNCNDIEDFVIENQYPLFSKFTINYLKKMNQEKKTICIFTLKKNKYSSIQTIMEFIQNIALNRRDIVFGYINIDTDYHLFEYIHIKKKYR